ncbi:MAG: HNH endonuclease [Methanoregula sp.]|nr:HNH endonuclease [Methanoregula sp.]
MEEIEDIIASAEEEAADYPDDNVLSWTIEDNNSVIKRTDRQAFLFRESVLPEEIRRFFSANDLQPGQKHKIVLLHGQHRFDATIEKTIHKPPRTRLMWRGEFAALLQKQYPEWYDFFKKNRKGSEGSPSIQFTRLPEPGHYEIELDGTSTEEMIAGFEMPINPGDTIDNETLKGIFRCSAHGSMRRSLPTNSLVLISDHTVPEIEDTWIGRIFQFTGIGSNGEQSIGSPLNKTLAESKTNGISLYLFEVFEEGHCVYIGEVEPAANPYRSRQTDREKNMRDVCVFPLCLKGNKHPPLRKNERFVTKEEISRKTGRRLPRQEPLRVERLAHTTGIKPAGASRAACDEPDAGISAKQRADGICPSSPRPGPCGEPGFDVHHIAPRVFGGNAKRDIVLPAAGRDPYAAVTAKQRANGICRLCLRPGPFTGPDGEPWLDTHHIVPLDKGGTDTSENIVALCPNCHRKMHVLNLPVDVAVLKKKAAGKD